MTDSKGYWALSDPETLTREAFTRVNAFYDFCRRSPHFLRVSKAYRTTFGVGGRDGVSWELTKDGKQGELVRLQSGDYRNLGENRVTIATQQKPSWVPIATNSDFASLAQATVVSGVCDYYWREKRVWRHLRQALKDIQWAGEGYVFHGWDPELGEAVAHNPETMESVKEGDLWFSTPTIYDVIRDVHASSWRSGRWRIVRVWENKWDLAAKYPEKAEDIANLDAEALEPVRRYSSHSEWADEVPVFHLIHDKCPALPEGLYHVFASGDVSLLPPGPYPYRDSMLTRLVEDEMTGTPFGYTALFDALGPLEAADKLSSAILTQQMAHAVQKIVGVKGSGLNYKQLTQGLGFIEVNSMDQKPDSLNLATVESQVFQYEQELRGRAQRIANLNDVAMGKTTENVKSGAHAALFDAIALRGANALQEAYFAASEDIGTFVLHALADFAPDSERTARIVGEHNRPLIHTFTGRDLQGFERVTVEAGNSALKTMTGKQAVADALLEKGVLGGPGDPLAAQKYLTLIKTGEMEQLTEAPQAQVLRLKRDKELLAKGVGPAPLMPQMDPATGMQAMNPDGSPVMEPTPQEGAEHLPILATDPHWLDIPEYLTVLSSPEARANPAVVQAVTDAVLMKLQMWRSMDPDLLVLLGGSPPPSMMMAMQAAQTQPPAPGSSSGTPVPASGSSNGTPAPEQAELPSQPNMPKNPQTGESYDPTATGAVA